MFSSLKDRCENLKKKFMGFAYRDFLEFDVQTGCKQKLLIISNFSESFIKIGKWLARYKRLVSLRVKLGRFTLKWILRGKKKLALLKIFLQ